MLTRPDTLEDVVHSNLCTSCGTCVGICPTHALAMRENHAGIYVPILDTSRCTGCRLCLEACPGYAMDFAGFDGMAEDAAIGNIRDCYVAHAADDDVRARGQSGGLVSSLLLFALERGVIDGAIVTRMSQSDPLRPETFIARSKDDILEAAGSKYCPVAANVILRSVLEERGRFAFVGIPCQIHGIKKAESVLSALRDRIVLHLGLFCDKTLNFYFQDYILAMVGVRRRDVQQFAYRDKGWRGWPGDVLVRLEDGGRRYVPRAWRVSAKPFFTPQRCYVCGDKLNILADISLGDPWTGDQWEPRLAHPERGLSAVITRTAIGERLVREAMEAERIKVERCPADRIVAGQGISERKAMLDKYFAASRILGDGVPLYGTGHVDRSKGCHGAGMLVAMVDMAICKLFAGRAVRWMLTLVPRRVLEWWSGLRGRIISRSVYRQ